MCDPEDVDLNTNNDKYLIIIDPFQFLLRCLSEIVETITS